MTLRNYFETRILKMAKQTVLIPLKWEGSIILILTAFIYDVIAWCSPFNWVVLLYEYFGSKRTGKEQRMPMWIIDLFIIILLFFEIIVFIGNKRDCLMICIGIIGLIDILSTTLRDVVLSPAIHKDEKGSFIQIRNSRRWFLMAAINVLQVIICFGIIILYVGAQNFNEPINEPLNAFYFSLVTFTTVGYGDFCPVTDLGKIILSGELLFFFLLILTKVPIAVNIFRVKEVPESNEEKKD
jgi:hypothetical protein